MSKTEEWVKNLKETLNTAGNPSASGAVNVKRTGIANPDKE